MRQGVAEGRLHLLHTNFGKNLQKLVRSEVFYFGKAAHSQMKASRIQSIIYTGLINVVSKCVAFQHFVFHLDF